MHTVHNTKDKQESKNTRTNATKKHNNPREVQTIHGGTRGKM